MRSTRAWAQDLERAQAASEGGFWDRVAFYLHFTPLHVLALVQRLDDADRVLQVMQASWEAECEAERAGREKAERALARVRALAPAWQARTPNIVNGWVEELKEALTEPAPIEPEDPDPHEPEPDPKVAA